MYTIEKLFIKDGNFMVIDENGNYHIADYISTEQIKSKLREKVANINDIKMKNLNSLIINSIKEATGFKKVIHCKIKKTPNFKIETNDPLYESFVKYIQSLEDYKAFLQKQKQITESINDRKNAGLKNKQNENNYFDMYLTNKYKRIRKYCSK